MEPLIRTARTTGLLYLGLAVTGLLGFLLIRSQLFVADDPGATLANLVGARGARPRRHRPRVAHRRSPRRSSAVWFYRLFRGVDAFAAGGIAAFGLVNAVAILASAALPGHRARGRRALAPVGDAAATVQLLYLVSGNLWSVGGLFFGLWLIPMGWCVLRLRLDAPAARLDPRRRRRRLRAQRPAAYVVPDAGRARRGTRRSPRPWGSSG